jgi:signal recognition particle receptor subunit beta
MREIPLVILLNKRDLPDAVPVAEMKATLGIGERLPCFEAVAIQGLGVPQTLQTAMRALLAVAQRKLQAQSQTRGASA